MVKKTFSQMSVKEKHRDREGNQGHQEYPDSSNLMRKFTGVADRKGRLQFANEATLQGLGYSEEEILRKPFWEASWFAQSSEAQRMVKDCVLEALEGETVRCQVDAYAKDGTAVPVTFNISPVKGKDGSILTIAAEAESMSPAMEMEELRGEGERLLSVFELIKDVYFEADSEDRFTVISQSGARLLGYESPQELLGNNIAPFWASSRRRDSFLKKLMKDGKVERHEASILRKDGKEVAVELDVRLLRDVNGDVKGSEGVFRDITERKEFERRLKEAHACSHDTEVQMEEDLWTIIAELETSQRTYASLYGIVVERASDGVGIEQDGVIKFANPKLAELAGCSVEELIDMPFADLMSAESLTAVLETYDRRKAEGATGLYELDIVMADGRYMPVEVGVASAWYDGKAADVFIARDITERRRWEEESLRASVVFETMSDAVFISDITGILVDMNAAVTDILGYEKKSLVGVMPTQFISDDEHQRFSEHVANVLSGKRIEAAEYLAIRNDGSEVPMSVNLSVLKNHVGEPIGIVAVVRDVSERKWADDMLREREQRYRELFESSPEAIFLVSVDGIVLDCNSAVEKVGGLPREEVVGKLAIELHGLFEEDLPKYADVFSRLMQGQEVQPIEVRVLDLANMVRWHEVYLSLIWRDNEISMIQAIMRDVTERKLAEEELRRSQERYEVVAENMNDGIVILDANFNVLFINESMMNMVGYSREEVSLIRESEGGTRQVVLSMIAAGGPEAVQQMAERLGRRTSGESLSPFVELRLGMKDGSTLDVEVSSSFIEFDGQPADLVLVRDIGDRKCAEEGRLEAEKRYRAIFNNSLHYILVNDLEGCFIEANEELLCCLGYDEAEFSELTYGDIAHPDDVSKAFGYLRQVLAGDTLPPLEIRVLTKFGDIIWLSGNLVPLERDGVPYAVLGIAQDITERKLAGVELEASAENLKDLVQKLKLSQEELSTPVVRAWDRILALPLIGVVDTYRAQSIMDVLLTTIMETQSKVVIVDVTGVASMDTEVTNHLIRTVQSTKLLGAECVITGIRPEVAQTMTHLGVDMSRLVIKSDMQDGLRWGLKKMGYII